MEDLTRCGKTKENKFVEHGKLNNLKETKCDIAHQMKHVYTQYVCISRIIDETVSIINLSILPIVFELFVHHYIRYI